MNGTGLLLPTLMLLSQYSENSLVTRYPAINEEYRADPNNPVCYGMYGCFPITHPWTDERRPIALYPESPAKLDVRFPVFNHRARTWPKFIDPITFPRIPLPRKPSPRKSIPRMVKYPENQYPENHYPE